MFRLISLFLLIAFALVMSACKPSSSREPMSSEELSEAIAAATAAEDETMRQLVYVVGQGASSWSASGRSPVSNDKPIAMLVWGEGLNLEGSGIIICGMMEGMRMMPGAVGLSHNQEPLFGLMPVLPLSRLEDPSYAYGLSFSQVGTADIPVLVRRLDNAGGEVHMDLSQVDPKLAAWSRDVVWRDDWEIRLYDEMVAEKGEAFAFSFVGSFYCPGGFTRTQDGKRAVLESAEFTLIFDADVPIELRAYKASSIESDSAQPEELDRMLNMATIVVVCTEPVERLELVTRMIPKVEETE
ncbi:hypothetical protein [Ruficoccus sp. ZRK36]|uniref:hypothetical protein n=1 Tax=Ruficoccus sp. ZRK36 TaxID=2866311 RepID=UPI001C73673A|nr:hypothetical protein [Ruficoccus sp. ZRK36]QYY36264.1 hypothetical protein K0V07_02075 [Ruficoccus sp. ZRK36]